MSRGIDSVGHDPIVALGVLGPDGGRHYGRPYGGDGLDFAGFARHVCRMVQGAARAGGRAG